jgi:1,4-alpha-glucan branching enzyme
MSPAGEEAAQTAAGVTVAPAPPTVREEVTTVAIAKTSVAAAPKTATKRRVTFKLVAPEAKDVRISGNFNEWNYESTALKKDASGVWKTMISLAPGTYEYRFIVDGEWRDDPECLLRVENPFGSQNCVRVV